MGFGYLRRDKEASAVSLLSAFIGKQTKQALHEHYNRMSGKGGFDMWIVTHFITSRNFSGWEGFGVGEYVWLWRLSVWGFGIWDIR